GCQATTTVTLSNPSAIQLIVIGEANPSCGVSDGSILITASGGTAPLQYSIDNGVTFQAGNGFTGLLAGNYDIVVEDGAGCQISTTSILTAPPGTSSSFSVALCDTYTVPSGDETYTTSGVYMDTIPNTAGCDSVMTISVHINEVPSITHFTSRGTDQFRVNWEYLLPVTINDTNFRIRRWESGFPEVFTDKSQFLGNFQKKLTGLNDNTLYEVKVGFACFDGSFVWSETESVMTKKIPCTDVTGQMQSLPLELTTATVTWDGGGADSYKLRFRPQSGGSWSFRTITGTSKTLAGLNQGTSYEYQVKAQCSGGIESSYGAVYPCNTDGIGVERLSAQNTPTEFNLYPNPSNGEVVLEMNSKKSPAQLILRDVSGRVVYTESLVLSPSFRQSFNFNVNSGSYLLQVISNDNVENVKVEIH
ncbi:MAG: hypothetical protein ACI9YU_001535, partial [Flavobacteriales bacterium]